jgi:hypothetical protein
LGKNNKSKAELEREVDRLKLKLHQARVQGLLQHTSKICGELFRAVRVVGPWAFGWLSVRELAGKVTVANMSAKVESESLKEAIIELVQKETGWVTACFMLALLAIAGLVYGKRQERLREDTVERLADFRRLFEESLDNKRSSSKITPRGLTRPEDE